jgi:hypothetical protein
MTTKTSKVVEATITKEMVGTAIEALLDRGYSLRNTAADPHLFWLQAPGPDHPSDTPWWAICKMSRTEAWNLIWNLYQQEVG